MVVYPGTHDNDTTLGWYEAAPDHEKHFLHRYLATDGSDVAWALTRVAWQSVAAWSSLPS